MIEDMQLVHLEDVIDIHIAAFPDSFLTQLGRPALKILYKDFSSTGFAYVYREDNKVLGVLAGTTTSVETFYQELIKKHLLRFALVIPIAVIQRPTTFTPILLRLRRLFQKPKFDSYIAEPEYDLVLNSKGKVAHALTIGVSPQSRGKGIAKQLWNHLLHDLPQRGVEAILGSVRSDNDITNGFYEKMGFKKIVQMQRNHFTAEYRWLFYWKDHCVVTESGKVEWNN